MMPSLSLASNKTCKKKKPVFVVDIIYEMVTQDLRDVPARVDRKVDRKFDTKIRSHTAIEKGACTKNKQCFTKNEKLCLNKENQYELLCIIRSFYMAAGARQLVMRLETTEMFLYRNILKIP